MDKRAHRRGKIIADIQSENISDEELMATEYVLDDPRALPNYEESVPEECRLLNFSKFYHVKKKKVDEPKVYCLICDQRTHYRGVVGTFSDGSARCVGHCCYKHIGDDAGGALNALRDNQERQSLLLSYEQIQAQFMVTKNEIMDSKVDDIVSKYRERQRFFERVFNSAFRALQKASERYGRQLLFERQVVDYASVERQNQKHSESTKDRMITEQYFVPLGGFDFLSIGIDVEKILRDIRKKTTELEEIIADTEKKTNDELKTVGRRYKSILIKMKKLQGIVNTLFPFTAPGNLQNIAAYLNNRLHTPTYKINKGVLIRSGEDGDRKFCCPPGLTRLDFKSFDSR